MSPRIVLTFALALGFLLLSYDQRTDDTGVEVALIVGSALVCTLAAPRIAIAITLAIGLPIAAYSLGDGHGSPGMVGAAIQWSGRIRWVGDATGIAGRHASWLISKRSP